MIKINTLKTKELKAKTIINNELHIRSTSQDNIK